MIKILSLSRWPPCLVRWCGGLIIFIALGRAGAAVAPPRPDGVPAPDNPALVKFGGAITFYQSFDHLPLIADISDGAGRPADISGLTVLESGLYGQALLLGPHLRWAGISYKAQHNISLSKPGALAVWISPYHWRRPRNQNKTPYLFFVEVNDHGRVLGLARMGNGNHEAVYAYAGVGGNTVSNVVGDSLHWRAGQWHLLVVNWRSGSLSLSLDGRFPGQISLASTGFPQAHGPPGWLILHGLSPREACLMDELLVFNHPLTTKEIKWLWRQGRVQARRSRRQ